MNSWMNVLFSMSVSGSVLILVLSIIKLFSKDKISNSMMYVLWMTGMLRFAIPVSKSNSLSMLFYKVDLVASSQIANDHLIEIANTSGYVDYVLIVWSIGVLISLLYQLGSYIRFKYHTFKCNQEISDEERLCFLEHQQGYEDVLFFRNSLIESPILIGLLNPILLIPTSYNKITLRHMIAHELSHYRYKDLWIKWIAGIITAVHWFNPIVHYGRSKLNQQCELACDERTIRHYNSKEKQDYGNTLISLASNNRSPLSAKMSDSKKVLKNRLMSIMKGSKGSRILSILILVLILSIAVIMGDYYTTINNNEVSLIDNILEYKTPYIGDSSKMSHLAGYLPVPQEGLIQRYISIESSNRPYGLTVYYEGIDSNKAEPDESRMRNNAAVMFALVDNMDSITFEFSDIPLTGMFKKENYSISHTYTREGLIEEYGSFSDMSKEDLASLLSSNAE